MSASTRLPTRLSIRGLAAILSLCLAATALPAAAQSGPGRSDGCAQGTKGAQCQQQPAQGKSQAKSEAKPAAKAQKSMQQEHLPRVGDSGRGGRKLQQANNSRLPAPPAKQHYRVVDDRVVRVSDDTLKIVAVVGLASALLGN